MLRRCCCDDEMGIVVLQIVQEARYRNRVGDDAVINVKSRMCCATILARHVTVIAVLFLALEIESGKLLLAYPAVRGCIVRLLFLCTDLQRRGILQPAANAFYIGL